METKKKTVSDYNPEELLLLEPLELATLLYEEYSFTISFNESSISIHDLPYVQELIMKMGNSFPYLAYLSTLAKIKVRQAKRDKAKKDEIEDAIDRKEAITNITESVDKQYTALSRLITVKQQINEELRMTNGI